MKVHSGLTAAQVLAEVRAADRRELAARNRKLIMAVAWAEQHPPESICPDQLSIPGGDRPLRLGGDGTPPIANFSVAEFAATLHKSRRYGEAMIADADEAVASSVGRLSWASLLRLLHAKIIEVDAANIARLAQEQQTRTGVFLGQVESGFQTLEFRGDAARVLWFNAMVNRLASILLQKGDQRSLGERQAAAMELMTNPLEQLYLLAEDANPTLFDVDPDDLTDDQEHRAEATDSQVSTMWPPEPPAEPEPPTSEDTKLPAAPPDPADEQCRSGRFPRIEHDRELAKQAIAAIGRLDPAKLRPDATLYVHIALETLLAGLGVARVEDIGPVVSSLVGQWLQTCDVTVKSVIDLNVEATPVDEYAIPKTMRERLFLKHPASRFPFSAAASRRMDLDHSDPYRAGVPGQTREDNLGPFVRREHNVITHGDWQRRQPEPGTLVFRAPHGRVFLVNSDGTVDLGTGHIAQLLWRASTPKRPS